MILFSVVSALSVPAVGQSRHYAEATPMNNLFKQLRHEQASSVVELAVVLPLLFFLILGVIDLGRSFRTYSALTNAAHEGVRWLTTHPTDVNGVRTQVVTETTKVGLPESAIRVTITPLKSSYQAGDMVTVKIQHSYSLLFGALTGIPTLPLTVHVTMRVLYG